jgi:hypothetical protein
MKPLPLQRWGRRLVAAALAIALVACPVAATAQERPSLAELARKEQERRKALKASAKVYTDKDAKTPPKPPATAPAVGAAPAATAATPAEAVPDPATGATAAEAGVKDQAWWKQRIDQAREELRRSQVFADALQTQLNVLAGTYINADPYQAIRIGEDRRKAAAELERVTADLDRSRKLIASIEEEARQAGVPPGWLR